MFAALNSFLTRAVSAGYFLNKSLRFRSSASAYLNRTLTTPTDPIKWTWSGWIKRGKLGAGGVLFQGYASLATRAALQFNSSDQLVFNGFVATATTTAVFRDPAAWYHIVCVYDSANATAANRLLLYVNGTVQTVTGAQPTASQVEFINGAWLHYLSTGYSGAFEYTDGELAEINFVDGQALAPTAFGAFSTYNQWLPIKYAGTYGTNGFYLPFTGSTGSSFASFASLFNGSTQHFTIPSTTAFTVPASGSFTIECWIKLSSLGADRVVFSSGVSGGLNDLYFGISSSNTIGFIAPSTSGATGYYAYGTTALAANTWYHIAVTRVGGTVRLFLNGVQETITQYQSGNSANQFGATGPAYIGTYFNTFSWFAGYVSNLRFVNGTAVYTSSFPVPTAPLTAISGTALLTLQNAIVIDNSTNAFTLTNVGAVVTSAQTVATPATPANYTADSSGNANNWTPNNISLTAGSTYDSLTDVPTLTSATVANYAVLNPLDSGMVLSSANLTTTTGSSANTIVRATIGVTSGKWYWEVTQGTANEVLVGVANSSASLTQFLGQTANGWGYDSFNGAKYNGTSGAYGATFTTGDVIGIALDMTAGTIVFYKNNTSQGTAFTGLTGTLFPAVSAGAALTSMSINFGQQPFVYTAPTGFLPLNTFNI